MDYTKFSIEDFASNDSFIDWVNQSDPEAVKYWNLYLSTHPEIRDTVEKARILVLNLKQAEETGHDAKQVKLMWRRLEVAVASTVKPQTRINLPRLMVMASLLFICIFGAIWFFMAERITRQSSDGYAYVGELPDFVEQVNETDQPKKVRLQDGSVVVLSPKSSLKYKADYRDDSTRNVYLYGEAFFEVVKNPYKPFIVQSNELFVKVLGTSFRVSAPENKANVIVSVKTGKVSVYANSNGTRNKKGGVILLPNQQVKYKRGEQSFEKTLIDTPEILNDAIKQEDFVFEDKSIAEVFRTIEAAYGIEIIFNEETMKNCYLTAPLGSESLQEKLKIICETIGANYEIIDANVVINSAGC